MAGGYLVAIDAAPDRRVTFSSSRFTLLLRARLLVTSIKLVYDTCALLDRDFSRRNVAGM